MEKLSQLRITNYEFRISFFIVALIGLLFGSRDSTAQQQPGAGVAVDSLHVAQKSIDSLLKADSLLRHMMSTSEREAETHKQLASQREIDLTNDGKPEILRISGYPAKNLDETKFTFTIKSGKKLLFEDSWNAAGYFDTIDHLPDSIKLKRLRHIITVFFANENFAVLDSADFQNIFTRVNPDELDPNSIAARELFKEPRVMYSIFHSRDYWYGIVWDPKREKFVKVWRN